MTVNKRNRKRVFPFPGLGPTCRRLRLARGLSVTQVADVVGCSQPFISMLEAGRRGPSLKTAAALAKILRVTLTELTEG